MATTPITDKILQKLWDEFELADPLLAAKTLDYFQTTGRAPRLVQVRSRRYADCGFDAGQLTFTIGKASPGHVVAWSPHAREFYALPATKAVQLS